MSFSEEAPANKRNVEFWSPRYNFASVVEPERGGDDWGPIPDFPTWFDLRISSWI
jgi:hypothetical protein